MFSRKPVVNTYKLKKVFKRKVHRLQNSIDTTFFARRRRPDFAWKGIHANPHVRRRKAVDWKYRAKLGSLIGISLTTAGLALYHPTFHIKSLEAQGLVRINEQEIIETSLATMEGNKTLIIPRSNYFFFDLEELKTILLEKYPIEHIAVEKKFPSVISITVEEKISNLIYDNGKQYGYVDLFGNVVEIKRNVLDNEWQVSSQKVTSTDEGGNQILKEEIISRTHRPDTAAVTRELGNLPVLYDARGAEMLINNRMIQDTTAKSVVEWYNLLSKRSDVPISYFEIQDETGNITVYTKEGWHIKARMAGVEEQAQALDAVLKEKISHANIQYVDVRYNGRVYWK